MPETLRDMIRELREGPIEPHTRYATAFQAACNAAAGMIVEIDEDTFDWFIDVLPPQYCTPGFFAFAEGAEPLRMFWRKGERYFVRRLSWDETRKFVRLAKEEAMT